MDRVTFDKVVTDQLSRSELLLTSKGHEYAEKAEAGTEVDRLEHFKKAAVLQGETTEQAIPWRKCAVRCISPGPATTSGAPGKRVPVLWKTGIWPGW